MGNPGFYSPDAPATTDALPAYEAYTATVATARKPIR